MTDASQEAFEAWATASHFYIPNDLPYLAWQAGRKALADEQAQAPNSRIASLYEELRKAIDEGSESMTHDDALKQIADWQDKEQAQAVEPAKISWKNLVLWYEAGANNWDNLRGIVTEMLCTHPAPPATGERVDFEAWAKREGLNIRRAESKNEDGIPSSRFGLCPATYYFDEAECAWRAWANKPVAQQVAVPACERAKVGDRRFESWYSESAISHERKQAMREAYEAGLNEAQQVAVPPGYALAMAVLQSSLYQFLDDVERAECDALIAAAQGAMP